MVGGIGEPGRRADAIDADPDDAGKAPVAERGAFDEEAGEFGAAPDEIVGPFQPDFVARAEIVERAAQARRPATKPICAAIATGEGSISSALA